VQYEIEPLEVQLRPGALLRLRVVDEQGVEVSDATVVLEQWGDNRQAISWREKSGPDGRIEWNSAPPARLQLCAYRNGWCYTRDVWITPDGQEHTIVLQRALELTGYVADAETSVPVDEFKVFPGYGDGPSEQVWERLETRRGENGFFKLRFKETRQPWRVRVEAEGYAPAISEPLPRDISGTLELKLARRGKVEGMVRLPDGQPVAGAEVALGTFEHWTAVHLGDARFIGSSSARVVRTDSEGRYSFAEDPEAHTLIAVHATGFARERLKPGAGLRDIVLQPWGRIEGSVLADIPASGEWQAVLTDWASAQYRGGLELDDKSFSAPLNASGHFVMERVPPGNFYVCLARGLNSPHFLHTPVSVPPGQTVQIQVGGLGRRITGHFDDGEVAGVTNWKAQVLSGALSPAVRTPRPQPVGLSPDEMKNWEVDFWQSDAGHQRLFTNRTFTLEVAPDGAFSAYDVPPGPYRLHLHVSRSATGHGTTIGTLSEKVVIPEADDSGPSEVDLGTRALRRARD
jgi:hypothetical protein